MRWFSPKEARKSQRQIWARCRKIDRKRLKSQKGEHIDKDGIYHPGK